VSATTSSGEASRLHPIYALTISPSHVGEPECNGVMERFIRTLKEQCLYLHRFESLEEARWIIAEFIARYETQWLIEHLGHRPPDARASAARRAA
jgi:putative transposase